MSKHLWSGLSSRVLSALVVAAMLGATLPSPTAAQVIGTEESLNAAGADRAALNAWLARDEVRDKLVSLGVDPAEVGARVDALDDEEVVALAGNLEELPAGGSALGVVAAVFVVLLVTDILGVTRIFPFTRPVR